MDQQPGEQDRRDRQADADRAVDAVLAFDRRELRDQCEQGEERTENDHGEDEAAVLTLDIGFAFDAFHVGVPHLDDHEQQKQPAARVPPGERPLHDTFHGEHRGDEECCGNAHRNCDQKSKLSADMPEGCCPEGLPRTAFLVPCVRGAMLFPISVYG